MIFIFFNLKFYILVYLTLLEYTLDLFSVYLIKDSAIAEFFIADNL